MSYDTDIAILQLTLFYSFRNGIILYYYFTPRIFTGKLLGFLREPANAPRTPRVHDAHPRTTTG